MTLTSHLVSFIRTGISIFRLVSQMWRFRYLHMRAFHETQVKLVSSPSTVPHPLRERHPAVLRWKLEIQTRRKFEVLPTMSVYFLRQTIFEGCCSSENTQRAARPATTAPKTRNIHYVKIICPKVEAPSYWQILERPPHIVKRSVRHVLLEGDTPQVFRDERVWCSLGRR